DAATKHEILSLDGQQQFLYLAWSPDSRRLVSVSMDEMTVWDLTPREDQILRASSVVPEGDELIHDISWSPDGRQLAAASSDGTVKTWDTKTGQLIQTLTGHENSL